MAEDLVFEVLKKIQAGQVESNERLTGIEGRIVNIERRLTAMSHFDQSIVAHVASIHSGIDNLRADFIGVEQRLKVLETR